MGTLRGLVSGRWGGGSGVWGWLVPLVRGGGVVRGWNVDMRACGLCLVSEYAWVGFWWV